jgi:hypothetical protein
MNLCGPASFYLTISLVTLVIMSIQNSGYLQIVGTGEKNVYCAGTYSCEVTNSGVVFIIKALYIIFWTLVLDSLCTKGLGIISWILALLPFMFMFLFIAGHMTATSPTFI